MISNPAPLLTPSQIKATREGVDAEARPIALALLVWLLDNPDIRWRHHQGGVA